MFSISAISATSLSSTSISMQGTSCRPAAVAARQRRSPAMIIQRPSLVGLTSKRFEHALLGNGRSEFSQIADFRARLVGIWIEFVDGQQTSDVGSAGLRQFFDVVRVVTHAQACGQASSRHGSIPRCKVFRIRIAPDDCGAKVKIDSLYAGDSSRRTLLVITVSEQLRSEDAANLFVDFLPSVVRLSCSVTSTPSISSLGFGRALTFSIVSSRSSVPSERKVRRLNRNQDVRRSHQSVNRNQAEGRRRVDRR